MPWAQLLEEAPHWGFFTHSVTSREDASMVAHKSELAVLVREAAAHKLRAAGSLAIDAG